MKYLYEFPLFLLVSSCFMPAEADKKWYPSKRYKGMAGSSAGAASGGSAPRTPTRMTPQPTGFSQVGARPGAPSESTGAAMSVLLSWHEKVVEVGGLGSIGRVMTDWRKV